MRDRERLVSGYAQRRSEMPVHREWDESARHIQSDTTHAALQRRDELVHHPRQRWSLSKSCNLSDLNRARFSVICDGHGFGNARRLDDEIEFSRARVVNSIS